MSEISFPQITVAILTYNGAQRIHDPLKGLAAQTALGSLFEVIVVNNASTDNTVEIVESHPSVSQLKNKGVVCRIIHEQRQGLTHARIRAVVEARGAFVCFLDDDTIPQPNYIKEAIKVFCDESVGLLVSSVSPLYDIPSPPSIKRRESIFAINTYMGDKRVDWLPGLILLPTLGAGMWVRKSAFLTAVPWQTPENLLSDRKGSNLSSGGDTEIGHLISRAGYKCVFAPKLRLQHVIPKCRLRTFYFCNLIISIERSILTLKIKYTKYNYSKWVRAINLIDFLFIILIAPFLILRRSDGFRDFLFILVRRFAKLCGPL